MVTGQLHVRDRIHNPITGKDKIRLKKSEEDNRISGAIANSYSHIRLYLQL